MATTASCDELSSQGHIPKPIGLKKLDASKFFETLPAPH
jgi:hypothetical protein